MTEELKQLQGGGKSPVADAYLPVAEQETYTIADLADEFGVSLRTLRFYESKGLLSPARVGLNRIYSKRDRCKLSAILKGKKLGFTLSEINDMLLEERKGKPETTHLKMSVEKIDEQIRYLELQKADVEQALEKLRDYRRHFS